MPDLNFEVVGAAAVPYAAVPLITFKLAVTNADPDEQIEAVALITQIRLEVTRRHYSDHEEARLLDLFGKRERWGQTLRNMLWTFSNVTVRPFTGSTVVDLPITCTYDFNIASAKYFYALESGEVPLSFLFSGTVFYKSEEEGLQVAQISWEREATYKLPVEVWQKMIDMYYPNSAWLYIRRDVFDRLYRYKLERGIPTWEQAIERLLAEADVDAKL